MARVGSGTWAAREHGSHCKDSRYGHFYIQNVKVKVLKEAGPFYEALGAVCAKFGYKVRSKDTYSYYCRRTASGGISPHATGTAVDINVNTNPATGGPYGGPNRLKTDMPPAMVAAIKAIRTNSGERVFGWGGDFRSFKDAMHWEIIASNAGLRSGVNVASLNGAEYKPGAPITPSPGVTPALPGAGQAAPQSKPQIPAAPEKAPPPSVILTRQIAKHVPDLTPVVPAGAIGLTPLSASLDLSISEPATLRVTYADPHRETRRWPVWQSAVSVTLDGARFTLQRLDAQANTITAEYVDSTAWKLTQHKWTEANRLTQSGGQGTRGQFITQIARRVLGDSAALDIQPGDTALVDLAADVGASAWETLRALCESVNWRVFTVGNRLIVGADEWLLRRTPPVKVTRDTPGIDTVEWSLVFGVPASEAAITADLQRWTAPPSQAVELSGEGPADGLWLIEQVSYTIGAPRASITLARSEPALTEPTPAPAAPVDGDTGASWTLPTPSPGTRPTPSPPSVSGGGGSGGGGPDHWRYPAKQKKHVNSPFGPRGKGFHYGVDLRAPMRTPILAARPGTVIFTGVKGGYGNCIDLKHAGNIITRYAHLDRIQVRKGQAVKGGEQIALSGNTGHSTGPHLHFEIRPNNRPVNPWPYIKHAP